MPLRLIAGVLRIVVGAIAFATIVLVAGGCHRATVVPEVRTVVTRSPPPTEPISPSNEPCASQPFDETPAATVEDLKNKPVVARCISGNRRLAPGTLRSVLSLRVGDPFDPDLATRDIRAIYALGTIDDIEVLVAAANGGVRLRYLVRERPWIKEVNVAGMSSLSAAELRSMIRSGELVDHEKLKESSRALAVALAKHGGGADARVGYTVEMERDNAAVVTFRVEK